MNPVLRSPAHWTSLQPTAFYFNSPLLASFLPQIFISFRVFAQCVLLSVQSGCLCGGQWSLLIIVFASLGGRNDEEVTIKEDCSGETQT